MHVASGQTKRPEQRDGAPHGGKRSGSRQHAPALPCMEASQQFSTVDRAGRAGVSGIHEADGAAPIQPPQQRDLSAA